MLPLSAGQNEWVEDGVRSGVHKISKNIGDTSKL
jgi:hypothetical protein